MAPFVLAAASVAAGARADTGKAGSDASGRQAIQRAVERGELVSLARILRLAQARVAGEILEVEIEQEQGRITYEVKILNAKGRVLEVKLDARSGHVVEIEDE